MFRILIVFLITLFLTACMVGPNYKKPTMNVPSTWKLKANQAQTLRNTRENWWQSFHDPVLNQLIAQAVANNLDLKIAIARVKEARATQSEKFAALFPKLDARGFANRGNPGFLVQNKRVDLFQADFDASWELDLFGGNRRKLEAQKAIAQSAIDDQNDVLVSLMAEVARNYIEYRKVQTQIYITKSNIASANQNLKLTRSLYRSHLVSDLEVSQANALFQTLSTELPALNSEMSAAKYRLATLLGDATNSIDSILTPNIAIPKASPRIILDEPATTIARRPDVRSAEQNLAAATALHSAAIAQLFPNIKLGGFYGPQNTNLFPGINVWSLGGDLVMPVLNFGKLRSQIKAADAKQEQAFYQYQKTVLNALEEIKINLTKYQYNSEN